MHPDDTARIPLRAQDRRTVRAYAIVDATDADFVNQWRWHLDADGYAVRNAKRLDGRRYSLSMQRALLGLIPFDGLEGDHIDRDRLNNRRSNLRIVTDAQQMQNKSSQRGASSLHRGVHWYSRTNRWRAEIRVNGRKVHIGYFMDEQRAADAAREARLRLLPFAID